MSNPRKNIVFVGPFEVLHGYPREVACHVTTRARSLSLLLLGAILDRCTFLARRKFSGIFTDLLVKYGL